jgi:uncharacterized protein YjlB
VLAIRPGGPSEPGRKRRPVVLVAYPRGQSWNLCRGTAEERAKALANIARVPLPTADPVYGADGPLVEHWLRRA